MYLFECIYNKNIEPLMQGSFLSTYVHMYMHIHMLSICIKQICKLDKSKVFINNVLHIYVHCYI